MATNFRFLVEGFDPQTYKKKSVVVWATDADDAKKKTPNWISKTAYKVSSKFVN